MQDNIGRIYEIIASLVGITGGVLLIAYRKRFLESQKKYMSKRDDFLNRKMLEGVQSRSDKNSIRLIVVVAIILILGALYQLIIAL